MTFTTGDIEQIRNYILSLPAEQRCKDSLSVPHATVPTPVYVRQMVEALPPAPRALTELASLFRNGNQRRRDESAKALADVFDNVWLDWTPASEAKLVTVRNAGKRVENSKAIWDRVLTPKYMIDTAELSGELLAMFLSGPPAIAAEIEKKLADAYKHFDSKYPGITPVVEMFATPPRLQVNIDAYMLEAYSWLDTAGYLHTPDDKQG